MVLKKEFKVKSEFMNVSKIYHAQVFNEDFSNPKKVKDKVNSLISELTKGMIKEILESEPSSNIVMMLLNAVYFKSKWKKSFDKKKTHPISFKNADGSTNRVPMMRMGTKRDQAEFRYASTKDHGVLEIPYKDSISMYIFLPHPGKKIATTITKFGVNQLEYGLNSLEPRKFDEVSIPKFKLKQTYDLKKVLTSMGMKKPFSSRADFMGISDTEKLRVETSIHKAVIEVHEEGTEAAAATQLGVGPMSSSFDFFQANRPFMFLIRDRSNLITLFAGIVNKL
ncbi:alpha-1-antiproteinase F-like [Brevipalpus obovatus]|uniref:alpha-1-antiproteinase F-like n=1 Tax=Brevipalpus obovatus TaxID=246614 RepID=UPI003D9E81FE